MRVVVVVSSHLGHRPAMENASHQNIVENEDQKIFLEIGRYVHIYAAVYVYLYSSSSFDSSLLSNHGRPDY
jgi:hypothetical protein